VTPLRKMFGQPAPVGALSQFSTDILS